MSANDEVKRTFDFVIVGAGAAGCLLAEKLSRSGQFSIGLIEAGDSTTNQVDTSHDRWYTVYQRPDLRWNLKTTPQPGCNGRVLEPDVGRMLGGCTSHNGQCYVRCNHNDYDDWEKEGCVGWNRKTMLRAFKNYEKVEVETEYHGSTGFFEIRPAQSDPFIESLKHGLNEINIPWLDDVNSEKQLGVGLVWANVFADYKRCGSYQAFIAPHLSRKNLTLICGAQASRILFEGKTAVGVEYIVNQKREKTYQVMAKYEVILSCGSLLSPHLLLLSGVGPKQHLEEHNIPVVVDLPGVGQNLSDHVYGNMYFKAKKELPSKKEWASTQAFGRIDGKYDDDLTPDFQYIMFARKELLPGMDLVYPPGFPVDIPHIFASVALLHPKSRGTVTLSSNNPLDNPVINPNYLQYEEDGLTFVHAANYVRNIAKSVPEWFDEEVVPGKIGLEEELKYWKDIIISMWHPVGTCRMGSDKDPRSVVNPKLKVLNTQHLRVIDASVMPFVPSGNTMAPTLAVADRGAEMVLEEILGLGKMG